MDEMNEPSEGAQRAVIVGIVIALGVMVMGGIYLADKRGASSDEQPTASIPTHSAPQVEPPPPEAPPDMREGEPFARIGALQEPLLKGWSDCTWSTRTDELETCAPGARKREGAEDGRTRYTAAKTVDGTLYLVDYIFEHDYPSMVIISSNLKTSSDTFPYYNNLIDDMNTTYGVSKDLRVCKSKDFDTCKVVDLADAEGLPKAVERFAKGDMLSFAWVTDKTSIVLEVRAEKPILKSNKPLPNIPIEVKLAFILL